MPDATPNQTPWRWAMLPLWGLFFLLVLFPELAFIQLRLWSGVVTQTAWINSPAPLCMALVAYLTWFAYTRCRMMGLSSSLSRAKAFSMAIYAAVACSPVRLEQSIEYAGIIIPEYRWLLMMTVALKLLCCIFILVLLIRYYFTVGLAAFETLPTLLPSQRPPASSASTESSADEGPGL